MFDTQPTRYRRAVLLTRHFVRTTRIIFIPRRSKSVTKFFALAKTDGACLATDHLDSFPGSPRFLVVFPNMFLFHIASLSWRGTAAMQCLFLGAFSFDYRHIVREDQGILHKLLKTLKTIAEEKETIKRRCVSGNMRHLQETRDNARTVEIWTDGAVNSCEAVLHGRETELPGCLWGAGIRGGRHSSVKFQRHARLQVDKLPRAPAFLERYGRKSNMSFHLPIAFSPAVLNVFV